MRDTHLSLLQDAADRGTSDAVALARGTARHLPVRRTRLPVTPRGSALDVACDAAVARLFAAVASVETLRTADPGDVPQLARDVAAEGQRIAVEFARLAGTLRRGA
jgi:hypothetical protein